MAEAAQLTLQRELQRAAGLLRQGRRTDAILIVEEVRAAAGNNPAIHFELGNLCRDLGDPERALAHFAEADRIAPDNPIWLTRHGLAHLECGAIDEATQLLEKAVRLGEAEAEAHHGLGVCRMNAGDFESAERSLARACELKPSDASIRRNLTVALTRLDRHDEALAHARKAVRLDEASPGSHLVLAETLAEMGEIEPARQQLEQTIRRHRTFGLAYDLLARIRRFSTEDMPFIEKSEKLLDSGMPARDRVALSFALGKMLDDCGEFDRAFAHYERANTLANRNYDTGRDERLVRDMCQAFTRSTLRAATPVGSDSSAPVFVVGMPRSGTTLIEQIIASHPQADGAGELAGMARIAAELFPDRPRAFGIGKARLELDQAQAERYAAGYLRVLRSGRPGARRIVDKMPGNFYYLGLIRKLFPNATIIHARRHPLDVALSCYFQAFTYIGWTNDIGTIGRIYGLYMKMMAHWNAVLGADRIVNVQYEQLVADPEGEARRLLAACDLEWDENVLEFFRRKRVVRTASIAQAREAIYTSSRMRWLNYAGHIEPFVRALEPWLGDTAEALSEQGIELGRGGWLRQLLN